MYTGLRGVQHMHIMKRPNAKKRLPPYKPSFIRKWREHCDKTLEEVAEKIGTTHATLSRIERGFSPYQQPLLEALAKEYETDVTSLLDRNPEDPERIWPVWNEAKPAQRKKIVEIAKTIIKPET